MTLSRRKHTAASPSAPKATKAAKAADVAERAWLAADHRRTARTLDLMLEAPVFTAARVEPTKLAWLLRHLAAAVASGVPLVSALTMLAQTHPGTPVGTLCADLAEQISRGASLADALAAHPAGVGVETVALVRAGERVGTFGDGLATAAAVLADDAAAASATRRAAGYPLLAVAAVGVLLAVLGFVATPLLASIDTGHELPSTTRLLLDLTRYLPFALVPLAVLVLGYRAALRIPAVAATIRARAGRWALRVPGLALLTRQRSHSRVAHLLAWLLAAGVPVTETLSLAAGSTSNDELRTALDRATAQVSDGSTLSEAFEEEPLLAALAPVTRAGEHTGSLPTLLRHHAAEVRRDADRTSTTLVETTETVTQLAATVLVLVWLLGLFVPVLLASAAL